MDPFNAAELAFLHQVHAPARMAITRPDGTPGVIPVVWSLSADQQAIELEHTELLETVAIDFHRVATAAVVIDVTQPSGRSQGIQLTGRVEHLAAPHIARIVPERVIAWGLETSSGARHAPFPGEQAEHDPDRGPTAADAMIAVVRRSAYDPEALARGQAQMARFERIHAAQPGYAGNVVVDLGDGDRFVVTLWASRQHAAAARTALGPVVRELLEPMERSPSRLLGVGPVVTTDLALAGQRPPGGGGQHLQPDGNDTTRFQPDPDVITWRLHLRSPADVVYQALTTDEGRASFWAERTVERGDTIDFDFPGGVTSRVRVLDTQQDRLVRLDYFGAVVSFELEPTGDGGTDLLLTTHGFAPQERSELLAGWLNVLFPLKAYVDHGVDLRNHDPDRTWWHGYADQ